VSALNDRPTLSYSDLQNVVHPNDVYSFLGQAEIQRANQGEPLKLHVAWYAENMLAKRSEIEIALNSSVEL
jgi:hypothetical protein